MAEGQESDTPTADAVNAYLNSLKERKQQESLDEEVARAQGREFFQMMRDIGELLKTYPISDEEGLELIPHVWIDHNKEFGEECSIFFARSELKGIGEGTMKYTHYYGFFYGKNKSRIPIIPELVIDLHTDQDTRDQAEELIKNRPDTITRFRTIYQFDKEGNYKKLSVIPRAIEDPRPNLIVSPGGTDVLAMGRVTDPARIIKGVDSPMNAGIMN